MGDEIDIYLYLYTYTFIVYNGPGSREFSPQRDSQNHGPTHLITQDLSLSVSFER